jgi:hypothetical protein
LPFARLWVLQMDMFEILCRLPFGGWRSQKHEGEKCLPRYHVFSRINKKE